jgi:hypothetical protein
MEIPDTDFFDDLAREEEIGIFLRGHLHIEHQLVQLISLFFPLPSRISWRMIGYRAKVELALACGLSEDLRIPLERIGSLRNDVAHTLEASITKQRLLDIYNGLGDRLREILLDGQESVQRRYEKPSSYDQRDLLISILLALWRDIKASIIVTKYQFSKRSQS